MSGREYCESKGVDYDGLMRLADKLEEGDYDGLEFGPVIEGRPFVKEKTVTLSAAIPESRIRAIDRTVAELGMTRSEFVRRAIERELLLMAV